MLYTENAFVQAIFFSLLPSFLQPTFYTFGISNILSMRTTFSTLCLAASGRCRRLLARATILRQQFFFFRFDQKMVQRLRSCLAFLSLLSSSTMIDDSKRENAEVAGGFPSIISRSAWLLPLAYTRL